MHDLLNWQVRLATAGEQVGVDDVYFGDPVEEVEFERLQVAGDEEGDRSRGDQLVTQSQTSGPRIAAMESSGRMTDPSP